jgi:CHAT domain-containing protein
LVVNTNHSLSISLHFEAPQPRRTFLTLFSGLAVPLALTLWITPAVAGERCSRSVALGAPTPLKTVGLEPATATFSVVAGHSYLIQVEEQGNNAAVEVLDPHGAVLVRSDHPEPRSGIRRALILQVPESLAVRVTGKEDTTITGTALVYRVDLASLAAMPECLALEAGLAAADADYARAEAISGTAQTSADTSARDAYRRAADEYTALGESPAATNDPLLRGQIELAISDLLYYDLTDWDGAADHSHRAAAMLGSADPYRRARAQALEAESWIESGRSDVRGLTLLERSRARLRRLVDFHRARNERYDVGALTTDISLTYLYQSRYGDCVREATAAAEQFEAAHAVSRRAQAWQNRALCLWGMGHLTEAREWFQRALVDERPDALAFAYRGILINTALLDYALGQFDESLQLFDRALRSAQQKQQPREVAQSLYGIGIDYYALGDGSRARTFLERALAMRTTALDRRGRLVTLRALATLDGDEGRLTDAIAADREALSLSGAPAAMELVKVQLARHLTAAGRTEDARQLLDSVLRDTAHYPFVEAQALLERGIERRAAGELRLALADLTATRRRLHALGSGSGEFQASLEIARILRSLGEPQAALAATARALALADTLRLQSANPALRSQLETPLRAAYELRIELLRAAYDSAVAAGDSAAAERLSLEAFLTADHSRARSLADVAAQSYPAALRQALGSQLRRRDQLYRELAARRFMLDSRLERDANDPRLKPLTADIAELERQVDALNTLVAARAARHGNPSAAPTRIGLPRLPADAALVSYWLGSESAYAWVISRGSTHWMRLSSSAAISQKALAFHRALARLVDVTASQRLEYARALADLVVQPLAPWLGSARLWLVVPDGALDYVPIAGLRVSEGGEESFAIQRHDVALVPAAWMLSNPANAEVRHDRQLLLVADPVYQSEDPRLRNLPTAQPPAFDDAADADSGARYERLPYTADEARDILAQFPNGSVDELTGLDATRARLLSLDMSRYRFIHIATHGIVDAQVPELSALILGAYDTSGHHVEGAVRVADLSLQNFSADVAVFSACDTALGKQIPSEGLVGIASTVLARGAKTVVASLWPVSDEMTARLMTEFYRHLLQPMNPVEALGAAMRSMLRSDEAAADPALWASYQVFVVNLASGVGGQSAAEAITMRTRGDSR